MSDAQEFSLMLKKKKLRERTREVIRGTGILLTFR